MHSQRDRFVVKGEFLSSQGTLLDASTTTPIANYKSKVLSTMARQYLYSMCMSGRDGGD